jgi:predicted TPR repeat methyltransferase
VTGRFRSSGDLIADRRFEYARELEQRGDLAGAADLYAQAAELAPAFASAWIALGDVRRRLDDRAGAIAAWQQAHEADPDGGLGAGVRLASLGAIGTNAAMTPAYVRSLFDDYAPRFDESLAAVSYRAPELLLAGLTEWRKERERPMRFGTMLDLGCGTGLSGAAFRPHVDWLVGVDLSPAMVAQARSKGLYDRLAVLDLMAFLQEATPASYDLAIAADVFVYLADLAPVLAATARVLAPDGVLGFTVESQLGDGVIIGEKLRCVHGADYVRAALRDAGLAPVYFEGRVLRTDGPYHVGGIVTLAVKA